MEIKPIISKDRQDYHKTIGRLLRKYIGVSNLVGFYSGEDIIGVLRGKPVENRIQIDEIKYTIKPLNLVRLEPSPRDINNAVSAWLTSKFIKILNKGYMLEEMDIKEIKLLKCANIDVYQHGEKVYIAVRINTTLEGETLDKIIRKLKSIDELIGMSVRTSMEYSKITRLAGIIIRILLKEDKDYKKYWEKIKRDYYKEGGRKLEWFKKQRYGIPIIIVKSNKDKKETRWLSSALVIQFHPKNYNLYKRIYPEAFNRADKELHKREKDVKKDLEKFIRILMDFFKDLNMSPKLIEISDDGDIYNPFSIVQLKELVLKFANGSSNNTLDVFKFGAVDIRDRKFDVIHIVTAYDTDEINYNEENDIKNLLNAIKIKLQRMGVRAWYHLEANTIDSAIRKAKSVLEETNRSRSIILQILADKDESKDSPYAKLRRKAYYENIPIQTLLKKRFNMKRGWNALVNNLAMAIYAKVGGRPWNLASNVLTIFKRAIYIGYDISRRGKGEYVGTAVVYDSQGQFLFHYPYRLPTYSGKDIIPTEDISAFINGILEEARNKYGKVDAVIIHKDGELRALELEGIREGVRKIDKNIKIIVLGFPNNAPYLYEGDRIVSKGLAFYAGGQLVDGRLIETYFIQTKFSLGHNSMPVTMLKVRLFYYGTAEGEIPRDKEFLVEFIQQIYNLSRLNWSTLKGISKAPVTIHYAHKASKILSYGISPDRLDMEKLYML